MTMNSSRRRIRHLIALAAAAGLSATLAACGSSTHQGGPKLASNAPVQTSTRSAAPPAHGTHAQHHRTATGSQATTTTDSAAVSTTTTSAPAAKRPKPPRSRRTHRPVPPPVRTTIAGSSVTPAYTGPNPQYCLQTAGLNDVRTGREQGIWEANFGNTPPSDSTAMVFLSGPYPSAEAATQYAQSLQTIPELAAAGGRWVASAASTSQLDFQVKSVAGCMAAAG